MKWNKKLPLGMILALIMAALGLLDGATKSFISAFAHLTLWNYRKRNNRHATDYR